MAKTVDVTIQMDKDIAEQAENLFNDVGMDFSTACNIFIRQVLHQGKIPFEIGYVLCEDIPKTEK